MIKFVCPSCGERLSVQDQNAGRRGICPSCNAINRIPLKGFAETQPNTPVTARSAGNASSPAPAKAAAGPAAATPSEPVLRGALSIPALSGRREEPAARHSPAKSSPSKHNGDSDADGLLLDDAHERAMHAASKAKPQNTSRDPSTKSAASHKPSASSEPNPFAPIADVPSERVDTARERRLPKPIKIVLLVIAAIAVVGGLYMALLYVLHSFITAAS